MFLGVIVMLNVLIAIVSDSYDNAQSRSRHLFLRSRCMLFLRSSRLHVVSHHMHSSIAIFIINNSIAVVAPAGTSQR